MLCLFLLEKSSVLVVCFKLIILVHVLQINAIQIEVYTLAFDVIQML